MPVTPHPLLATALADLLVATGASAVRVVDGRRGAVVAEVGATGGDDPATVVRMARRSRRLPLRPWGRLRSSPHW